MSITVTTATRSTGQPSAPLQSVELLVTLDNAYPTGGYDVTSSMGGLTIVASPAVALSNGTAAAIAGRLVTTNGVTKLVCYTIATGAQVAGSADLSLYAGVRVFGMGH